MIGCPKCSGKTRFRNSYRAAGIRVVERVCCSCQAKIVQVVVTIEEEQSGYMLAKKLRHGGKLVVDGQNNK